ncbi:MAG: hypothetical protein PHD21_02635 [Flavobacteriales bacterium]|nr:hypothetical protein [Flavobacteriales bacterium]
MIDSSLLNTPEQQCQWIQSTFIDQSEKLIECGFTLVAYMVIGQGVETMGAFLDKKPFKAKGQSVERFSLALKKMFPARYSEFNNRDFLYRNLRSNLTHLSVGSPYLFLGTEKDGVKHLWVENKKTSLVLERLFADYKKAWQDIITMINEGKLKIKPLVKE